ncbi:ARM repeat superfamily protein [Actinidia rufa]|uniref:ARM repeat superfamily protein n=1 Tax=Actinidia rufa TaxID=165716 RepID=A0A7J0FYC1_9ERIC|nr:ARM repeat superfamily protein [Actinidia rufa]
MDTPYELQPGLGMATRLELIQFLIQLPHKTTRQHLRYLNLINGLLHFPPKCLHLLTEVPCTPHWGAPHPHRGALQSTSLCELLWLYLSYLVRTTGEIIATDKIESKRGSFRRRRTLRYTAYQNQLGLLPLSFSLDILHWLHHSCLARLLYISQSISLRSCTAPNSLESLDLNYWRLVLSDNECANSKSIDSIGSCNMKGVKVVPIEESCTVEEAEGNEAEDIPVNKEESDLNVLERYDDFLMELDKEEDLSKKCKVVEHIRHLLKDDDDARSFPCRKGMKWRRKLELWLSSIFLLLTITAGVLPLLEEMVAKSNSHGSATVTALYLNLLCLEEAKPVIGSSEVVPFIISLFRDETDPQCKLDALHTLFNLSSHPSNVPPLLSAGIINGLLSLVTDSSDHTWTEKSVAVFINLASNKSARDEMISAPGLTSGLAMILDIGEPVDQEHAVACFDFVQWKR